MAVASLPSLSFRLQPARRSHAHITIPAPNVDKLQCSHEPRRAACKLQGREMSWRLHCLGRSAGTGDFNHSSKPVPFSTSQSDIIKEFYSSINAKDLGKLASLTTDDCVFEDLAFQKPFKGKEVHCFLKELTEAMGKHVRFSIEGVFEGGDSFVGVMWHLEWNEEPIPFTRGCSFYECSRNGGTLLIKSARIFVESPVKPGEIVLELLKIISNLFDRFPHLAEKFLKKPAVIVQYIVKIYKIFVEPFILPLLVYYTHIWTFAAWILSFIVNFLQYWLKFLM